jgi:rSAM/selenodomain-associated transferase 1
MTEVNDQMSPGRFASVFSVISPSCGIAVMAKASQPGRTKTRLVPPLTFEEAAEFNTAFLKDIACNLIKAGALADIANYVAFGPPISESFFRTILPPDIELIESWLPYFGDCLLAAVRALLARGHGSAVVLNSDSPTLPTSILIKSAQLLAKPGDRVVLGPTSDGGYYLLGLKQAHSRMFEDIAWSTDRVAAQTIERAQEIGLELHILPTWYDVDDIGSVRQLCDEVLGHRPFSESLAAHDAVYTSALIRSLVAEVHFATRVGVDCHPPLKEIERAATA